MAVSLTWPILGIAIPCVLIAGLGYGTHFFVLIPTTTSKWKLIGFQFALTMTWLSYFLAIKTPPGSPPTDFVPPPETVRRWCFKCNGYKPDRTHHCKTCKTCVTKMDHHCPWTYNCVGFNNMPHFIRFLLWVDFTTGYAFYRLVRRCIEFYQLRNMPSYMIPSSEIFMTILLTPFAFFVCLTVGLLTIRVLMNVTNGYTQIESWEEDRLTSAKRRGLVPRNTRFPYDLGLYTNLVNTMGPIYTWPLPWGKPSILSRPESEKRVIEFERNESGYDDEGNPMAWPPDVVTVDPSDEYLQQLRRRQDGEDVDEENERKTAENQELLSHEQSPHRRSGGNMPVTFAQTAQLQQQQQHNVETSDIRNFAQPPPWLAQQYNAAASHSNPADGGTAVIPPWRRNAGGFGAASNNDFYSRELWSTFEGEKLSDFGVDLDSEVDFSIYKMNRRNLDASAHGGQGQFSAELSARYGQNSGSASNAAHTSSSPHAPVGSSSSTSLSRASSPVLRHASSASLVPGTGPDGAATVATAQTSVGSLDLRDEQEDTDAREGTEGVSATSVTPYNNEEDLPLAKLLVMRRQEKIKLRTQ